MSLSVQIEKQLGSFHLDVQFETDGEILALLGASGCGKSMTLKCIAGIERPDRGRIVLNGKTLFDSSKKINLPPQKRQVGYLFQQYGPVSQYDGAAKYSHRLPQWEPGPALRPPGKKSECSVWRGWRRKKPAQLSAASSSVWRWPGFLWASQKYCCSTSRFPRWTAI